MGCQFVERHTITVHVGKFQGEQLRDIQQGKDLAQKLKFMQDAVLDLDVEITEGRGKVVCADLTVNVKVSAKLAAHDILLIKQLPVDLQRIHVFCMSGNLQPGWLLIGCKFGDDLGIAVAFSNREVERVDDQAFPRGCDGCALRHESSCHISCRFSHEH